MSSQTVFDLILGVVILALLIYRQVRARPVNAAGTRLVLILGVVGLIETAGFLQKVHAGATVIAALAGSLVLAAIFGAARAATVRLWLRDNQVWSQGNWLTAVLWVIALAAHLGYDALVSSHKGDSGLGSASIVLYLAVSLAVQRVIVTTRARRLDPSVGFLPGSPRY